MVDSIKPYLEWQSDITYLKNPPKGYEYPGYDLFGTLASVRQNIVDGQYSSELDFQTDLFKNIFGPAHDGHLSYYPDLLAKTFHFGHPMALVSISEDGKALPEIKALNDVLSTSKTASSIMAINSVPAAKYIEDQANIVGLKQDVDANYNAMFYQVFGRSIGSTGGFNAGGRGSLLYQGANTTFDFANGTKVTLKNTATIIGNWDGVVDGPSAYRKFCTPTAVIDSTREETKKAAAVTRRIDGYPEPIIITPDGVVSGYFLSSGPGLDDDIAVIALRGFRSDVPKFQAAIQDFLAQAVHTGKKKLVIDFQGNGGGYILLSYDFFRQLFPQIQEEGFSRWRASPAYMAISEIFSDEAEDFDPATSSDTDRINDSQSWFNYRFDMNLTAQQFVDLESKVPPQVINGDEYTSLMRWNLSNSLITTNATFGMGIEISGYGKRQNLTQPFAAENIVILYDGSCASTCALVSEMLRIQGGVRSVAMGGRPRVGPMQGVGGVKGAQALPFDNIKAYIDRAANLTKDSNLLAELSRYTSLAARRATKSGVNTRDLILRDDVKGGIPAQFINEPADCRLYWTKSMLTDMAEVWKAAADSAFNGQQCAYGGISRSQSVTTASSQALRREKLDMAQDRGPKPESLLKHIDDSTPRPPVENPIWKDRFLLHEVVEDV